MAYKKDSTRRRQDIWVGKLTLAQPDNPKAAGPNIKASADGASVIITNAAGTATTLNATELGFTDGVTAGTVAASKALVVDANKDLASLRNLTLTGALTRTGQEYQLSGPAKVGATAGWVVQPVSNAYEATLPQSQTGSTLVVPVRGLKVGWTVTAFKVILQVESGGNTVTVDADLRKLTNAASDPVDASIGAITQVSVTADTAVATAKTGLSEVIAADEWLYILITATTGATTDIRYLGCTVTVTES